MKAIALLITLSISMIAFSDSLTACTIFKATDENLTLVGNNEDWNDPDTKVWFLVPEEGVYGRVCFGFKNGWTQGGMNDQGLFFDWVAGFETDLTFKVFVKEGELYGQVQGSTPKRYRPASATKFFLSWYDQQIEFVLDADGNATKLKITSFDGADTAEKIES